MTTDLIKNMYRHDLESFARFSFQALYPRTEFQDNWHLSVLAEALTRAESGQTRSLIINLPPRMLKSFYTSIVLPAWILGRDPYKKLLCLHHGNTLGQSLHESCLQLMTSPRYRSIFSHTIIKEHPKRFTTSFGGGRQYMAIHDRLTGLGADYIIIDDPISAMDAQNDCERQRLNDQFDQNILQRLNNKKSGVIILVMQRLHEHDLTAHLLAKNEKWELINIPAIAFENEVWDLPQGRTHARQKGEALHQSRESREQLLEILTSIGGYAFAYQYLQGLYKPRFGVMDEGHVWLTPYREGEFWDARNSPQGAYGFIKFQESELIQWKVFGIGEDLCPDNMRNSLTPEEFEIYAECVNQRAAAMHGDREKMMKELLGDE